MYYEELSGSDSASSDNSLIYQKENEILLYRQYVKKQLASTSSMFKNVHHEMLKVLLVIWHLLDVASIIPTYLLDKDLLTLVDVFKNNQELCDFGMFLVKAVIKTEQIKNTEDEQFATVPISKHLELANKLDEYLKQYFYLPVTNSFVANFNDCVNCFKSNEASTPFVILPSKRVNTLFRSIRRLIKNEYFYSTTTSIPHI